MTTLGKCVVCSTDAVAVYPLLPNSPAFCSPHHNTQYAGLFGCDFSGPDDFDIPDLAFFPPFSFDRKNFTWIDRSGQERKLADIDNPYLRNIAAYLRRRLDQLEGISRQYWSCVLAFLNEEMALRGMKA